MWYLLKTRVRLIPPGGLQQHHTAKPNLRLGPGFCTKKICCHWLRSALRARRRCHLGKETSVWLRTVGAAVHCYQSPGAAARGWAHCLERGSRWGTERAQYANITECSPFKLSVTFKLHSNSREEVLTLSPFYR